MSDATLYCLYALFCIIGCAILLLVRSALIDMIVLMYIGVDKIYGWIKDIFNRGGE